MDKTVDYVLEVARCGGISRAARNLYITPSALSKFILQKEAELGVKLFSREGNRFVLTYPGTRYVEMLTQMREYRQKMDAEMSRLAAMYSGTLRVGFQMSLAEFMIQEIVPGLREQFPSIHVTLEEDHTPELLAMLRSSQLDIVLSLLDEEEADSGLHREEILTSPVSAVVPSDSPLIPLSVPREGFSHPWVSADSLAGESFLIDRSERLVRRYAPFLLTGSFPLQRSSVSVNSARSALLCVREHLGILILPDLLVRALRFQDQVALLSFGQEEQHTRLCVVSDPRSALAAETEAFASLVRSCIQTST